MKRHLAFAVSPLIALLLTGCAITPDCLKDRARDLTDVAHVDLTCLSLGAGCNVGPAVLGGYLVSAPCGQGTRMKFGLGLPEGRHVTECYGGVIWPIVRSKTSTRAYTKYGETFPTWGSIGCDMGFFFGASARVDVVELCDFILGFFWIDFLEDDDWIKIDPSRKKATPPSGLESKQGAAPVSVSAEHGHNH